MKRGGRAMLQYAATHSVRQMRQDVKRARRRRTWSRRLHRMLCFVELHSFWRSKTEYGASECRWCGLTTHIPLDRMG